MSERITILLILLLIIFLVFYNFFLGLLLSIGMSSQLVDVIKFSKEGMIVLLLCLCGMRIGRWGSIKTNKLDFSIFGLFALCTIYLMFYSKAPVPDVVKIDEYRIYLYVFAAYWIGRYSYLSAGEMIGVVRAISSVVLISALVSILNQTVLDYGLSGIADVYRTTHSYGAEYHDVLSMQESTAIATLGGFYLRIRNLNSSWLALGNSLVLASFSYLGLYYFYRRRKDFALFSLSVIILVLSGARAAAASMMLVGLGVIMVKLKKPMWSFGILTVGVILVLTVDPLQKAFLLAVANATDVSSVSSSNGWSHLAGWYLMIKSFIQNPYGYGFGTSERTHAMLGSELMTGGESNISHFVGNMGFIGGGLWLISEGVVFYIANRTMKYSNIREVKALSFIALFVSITYLLISLTQYLDSAYDVIFPFWFIIGWVSSQDYFYRKPLKAMIPGDEFVASGDP